MRLQHRLGLHLEPGRVRACLRHGLGRSELVRLHEDLPMHHQHDGFGLLHERVLWLQDERGLPVVGHDLRRDLPLLPLAVR